MVFFQNCNADFRIIVPTFRLLRQPIKASQSPNIIFDGLYRLSKVIWGYWRRTASKSQRSALFGLPITTVSLQANQSPSRALT